MSINPEHILQGSSAFFGILLVASIVFAESGLLIGFFLPGDTLLFTAGFLASKGNLPLGWLLLATVFAAVLGDNVGYYIGKRAGPRLFTKEDGIFFRAEYIARAQNFYEKHGGKTVTIARFVPIVRTFAPVVAGVGRMDRKRFFMYNIVGATVWAVGVTMLGFTLGNKIPNIDKILLPIIAIVMIISFSSPLIHAMRDQKSRRKLIAAIKKPFQSKK